MLDLYNVLYFNTIIDNYQRYLQTFIVQKYFYEK